MRLPAIVVIVFGTAIAIPIQSAQAQCVSDNECKSGRICMSSGVCATPACTKDIDCPGDLICSLEKICSSPTTPPPTVSLPKAQTKIEMRESEQNNPPRLAKVDAESRNRKVGFTVDARIAYGIPFGETTSNSDFDNTLKGVLYPVFLDAGYRISEKDAFFASFMYGPTSEICDDISVGETDAGLPITVQQSNCRGSISYLGASWTRHFPGPQKYTPWFGLGAGYEWYSVSSNARASTTDSQGTTVAVNGKFEGQLKGFQFANLQGGLDWPVAESVSVGPFAMATVGRFAEFETKISFTDIESPTQKDHGVFDESLKALHEWFVFGIRASFN